MNISSPSEQSTRLSLDALRQLAQDDLESFQRLLTHALSFDYSQGTPVEWAASAHYVADFLRTMPKTLRELGFEYRCPEMNAAPKSGKPYFVTPSKSWQRLSAALAFAPHEDAIVIKQSMLQILSGRPMGECFGFMMTIFQGVGTRDRIIKDDPDFFLVDMGGDVPLCNLSNETTGGYFPPSNAFQVLAYTPDPVWDEELYTATLATLRILKEVGVKNSRNPINGSKSLHSVAASHRAPHVKAFIEEFPEDLNCENDLGQRPLDVAVAYPHPETVNAFLDAGAHTGANTKTGKTPLDYAVAHKRYGNVQILLNRGVYTDADVDRACSTISDDADGVAQVRAYHAAVKAVRVTGKVVDGEMVLPFPL